MKKTDMEILVAALAQIGVPFELTDDSEESVEGEDPFENILDTVVVIPNTQLSGGVIYFFFRRDGSYKEYEIL